MAYPERQAWWTLGVTAATLAIYFLVIALWRFDSAAMGVFGLSGLLGVRLRRGKADGDVIYDERDRDIERRALLASLMFFYLAALALGLVTGFWTGWESAVPFWTVWQAVWAALIAAWGVKAGWTISLYRRSVDA
jgi:hypothetical protein